jgi:hypothetical protein
MARGSVSGGEEGWQVRGRSKRRDHSRRPVSQARGRGASKHGRGAEGRAGSRRKGLGSRAFSKLSAQISSLVGALEKRTKQVVRASSARKEPPWDCVACGATKNFAFRSECRQCSAVKGAPRVSVSVVPKTYLEAARGGVAPGQVAGQAPTGGARSAAGVVLPPPPAADVVMQGCDESLSLEDIEANYQQWVAAVKVFKGMSEGRARSECLAHGEAMVSQWQKRLHEAKPLPCRV